jgi:hypothetical protein
MSGVMTSPIDGASTRTISAAVPEDKVIRMSTVLSLGETSEHTHSPTVGKVVV